MNLISKKISLDDSVTIKLTKHGAELYLEWAKRYEHLDDIIVEENDEIKIRLWEVFEIFGPHIWEECESPFVNNEMIVH